MLVKNKEVVTKGSRVKQWLLSLAIAIVFTLFINYAISTVWENPYTNYESYCPQRQSIATNKTSCEAVGGFWTEYGYEQRITKPFPASPIEENITITGYCDHEYSCRKAQEKDAEVYRRNGFLVSTIAGLIALFVGLTLTLASVSTGLSLGGIVTIFIGTVQYWSLLSKYVQLAILAITLVALIWAGYRKLQQ